MSKTVSEPQHASNSKAENNVRSSPVHKVNVTLEQLQQQQSAKQKKLRLHKPSTPVQQAFLEHVRSTQLQHPKVQLRYVLKRLTDMHSFVLEYIRQRGGRVAIVFPDTSVWRMGWQQTIRRSYAGFYPLFNYQPAQRLVDDFFVCYLMQDAAKTLVYQKWDLVVYIDCLPSQSHFKNPDWGCDPDVLHVACHPVKHESLVLMGEWFADTVSIELVDRFGRAPAGNKCEQVVLELPMSEQELSAARGLSPQSILRFHAWPHLTVGYKLSHTTPAQSTKMKLVNQIMSTLQSKGDVLVRVLLITHFGPLAEHVLSQLQRQGCHTLHAPRSLTRSHFLWDMVCDFSTKCQRVFVVASDANIALDLFAAAATHVFVLDGCVSTPTLSRLHHSAHAMMAYLRVSIPDLWLDRGIEQPELCDIFQVRPESHCEWRARLTTTSLDDNVDVTLSCVSLSQLEGCAGLVLFKGFVPQLAQPVLLNMSTLRDLKSLLGHLWHAPANAQSERLAQFVRMAHALTVSRIDACGASALLTFCLAKTIVDALCPSLMGISRLADTYIMYCRDAVQKAVFVIDALRVSPVAIAVINTATALPDSAVDTFGINYVGQRECLDLLIQKFPGHTVHCSALWSDMSLVTQWSHPVLPELCLM